MKKNKETKVFLLIPLWGEEYRKFFYAFVWPSLCAPGNLPALFRAFPVQIVFLTKKEDYPKLSKDVSAKGYPCDRLTTAAVWIDDLCGSKNTGVILTLAYARGIFAKQAEVSDPIFVFLNNDFILSENTLEHLAGLLKKGKKAVMMPSLRVNLEDVRESLLNKKDQRKNILQIPGREMVKLGLSHLHTTTLAKEVTNQLFHSTHPNQLIWQIDDQTILARFFLIFMFALVPNRKLEAVNSFCDYGLMDDLCLGEPLHVIADSDDACLLELQPRIADAYLIRWGPFDHGGLAESLSSWINPRHVEASKTDIVYHSGEVSSQTEKVKKQAAAFMVPIYLKLRTQNYKNHPHWKSGFYDYLSKYPQSRINLKEKINTSCNLLQDKIIKIKANIARLLSKDLRYEFTGVEAFCDSCTMELVKKIHAKYGEKNLQIIIDKELVSRVYYSFLINKKDNIKFFFCDMKSFKDLKNIKGDEPMVAITKDKKSLKNLFTSWQGFGQIYLWLESKKLRGLDDLIFYYSISAKLGEKRHEISSYINMPIYYYNKIVFSKKNLIGDYRESLNKIFLLTLMDLKPKVPYFLRKSFPYLSLWPENNFHEQFPLPEINTEYLESGKEKFLKIPRPLLGWTMGLQLQKLLFRILSENIFAKRWQRTGFVDGLNSKAQIICFEANE